MVVNAQPEVLRRENLQDRRSRTSEAQRDLKDDRPPFASVIVTQDRRPVVTLEPSEQARQQTNLSAAHLRN